MRNKVGYDKLSISVDPPRLSKIIPDVYCDLSAIAKGYGVDKVAEFIELIGFTNYLVEIGGEVRTGGRNLAGNYWRIGISTPGNDLGIEKVVPINNSSMATSGDYRNYFKVDGKRYSHTIDSRTGYPITHQLTSVTVVHDSCVVADAIATAINVLGPQEGFELAIKENIAAFLIIREDEGFIEKMTPQFEELLNVK